MTIQQKTSNVYLAFKFAILDNSHSKSEIWEILQDNLILAKELKNSDSNEDSLEKIINFYSENGSLSESNKILLELLRKKYPIKKPDIIPVLKTLDTMLWTGGLEVQEIDKIENVIGFYENVENSEVTEKVVDRILKCIDGYQDYDVQNYLSTNF